LIYSIDNLSFYFYILVLINKNILIYISPSTPILAKYTQGMEGKIMAIPAYLWLKDDGGAAIKGSVDIRDREGSIEVPGFAHGLFLPTDNTTGKITGTRVHGYIAP
jgi:hypothetical protein